MPHYYLNNFNGINLLSVKIIRLVGWIYVFFEINPIYLQG